MKRYIAVLLATALLLMSVTAFADVAVQNDQISAYMDSSGGVILTGYTERINATDAYELVTIDAGRVVYIVETEDGTHDLMYADFATATERLLVSGVDIACGYGDEGIYYVPSAETNSVYYIKYNGQTSQIWTSEEQVAYLQQSHYGLMIGLDADAGAVVMDNLGEISAFNGILGIERRIAGDMDLVLTDNGELYIDDPAVSQPALVSAEVEQFEAINGYVYYIRANEAERTLMQYDPATLSWQYVLMDIDRTPISLTASYTQALVMDNTGIVYSIDDATCMLSSFATITAPEGVDIADVFIDGVSGQLNVYTEEPEETEYVLAFNFNYASDISEKKPANNDRAAITLLASCQLESELNTFNILTPAKLYELLAYGSRGDAVTELQQQLTDLGYLNDKVDGIFGPRTQRAVMLFQDFNGLAVTGSADKEMQELLFQEQPVIYDPYRAISYGARGLRVTEMQERLRYLGYMADPADGIYGPYTRAAVKLFQEENGLYVNGVADRETLVKLYDYVAPKCSSYFEMNYGDSGWRVKQLNKRLKDLYYMEGSAGSSYNSDTKAAVKKFQRQAGLTQTGVASAYMQQKLFAYDAPEYSGYITLRRGDENGRVAELQTRLRRLGYFSGKSTGYFGKVTYNAVKDFQKVAGLEVTGVATVKTQELLFSKNAPEKPVIAEITVPVINVSNVIKESEDGVFYVEDTIISIKWKVEGRVDEYYVEITDSLNRVIDAGYITDTEVQLDISRFTSRETFKVTVYAIPENGSMDHAKHASVYIVIPERTTPEPTPVPTPIPLVTLEPTPEVTVEPTPAIEVPVISVGGDYVLEGNAYVVGDNGAVFSWNGAADTAYTVAVVDEAGNGVFTPSAESGLSVTLSRTDLAPDTVYYLMVTAYPVGGDPAFGKSVRVMVMAGEAEPDPTEEPTAAPIELIVNVSGADKIADVWYIGEEPATISWIATGDVVDYNVELIDSNGEVLKANMNTADTSISLARSAEADSSVYGLRITANGASGSTDETIYIGMKQEAPTEEPTVDPTAEPTEEPTAEPTVEPTAEPTVEPTEEPTAEPTIEPTAEPTEEPTAEPQATPVVNVTVENAELNGDVYLIKPETPAMIYWNNTGDATLYSLYLADDQGNILQAAEQIENTSMTMDSNGMEEGRVYAIRFLAHDSTGDIEASIELGRYVEATEEPSAEPTAEPAPAVGIPVIEVTGYNDFTDGVYVVGNDGVHISWLADGDLGYYDLYIYNDLDEQVKYASGVSATSLELDTSSFESNRIYRFDVVAVPSDGNAENGMTASAYLVRPENVEPVADITDEPTAEPTEEPTAEPTEEPAYTVSAPVITISGHSDFDGTVYYVGEADINLAWHADGDLAAYSLYIYDADGVLQESAEEVPHEMVTLGAASFAEGMTYTFRVVAIPVGGTAEDGVVSEAYLLRPVPAVTEEPTAEPTAEPEAEITAEPTAEPVVEYAVSAPVIAVEGYVSAEGADYYVAEEPLHISWSAEGDLAYYNLYLYDGSGMLVNQAEMVSEESLNLETTAFVPDARYELVIFAIPVNGDVENGGQSSSVFFIKNAPVVTDDPTAEPTEEPTPEPTEEPTPEPVYEVNAPEFYVEGYTDHDGTSYIYSDYLYIQWHAGGDLSHYNIYLYDENGNMVNYAENVSIEDMTIDSANYSANCRYGLYVEAVPVNGENGSGKTASISVMYVPEPEPTAEPTPEPTAEPTPEPEPEPELPDPEKYEWDEVLNAETHEILIYAYQQKLCEWGWIELVPDGTEIDWEPMAPVAIEGKFDMATMEGTLALQTYINELNIENPDFVPMLLIDMTLDEPYVDIDLLQHIMLPDSKAEYLNPVVFP